MPHDVGCPAGKKESVKMPCSEAFFFGGHREAVKRPKCSSCKKMSEFYYQKDEKARKTYFCEDHGLEFMQEKKAYFLPRVKM